MGNRWQEKYWCAQVVKGAPFLIYDAFQQGNAPAVIVYNRSDPILFESAMTIDTPIFDSFVEDVLALFSQLVSIIQITEGK